jgi:mannose-6-phosphate isomerase-like protein (cupin superfamily)
MQMNHRRDSQPTIRVVAVTNPGAYVPVDLTLPAGEGPLWGMASEDLNATLLCWAPGHGVAEHVNPDLDVLIVVLDGCGVVRIDRREILLGKGQTLLIRKGASRSIQSGAGGLRYLSVHRKRGGLQIEPIARR